VNAEVISSTFDEPAERCAAWPRWSSKKPTAGEHKKDVVILLTASPLPAHNSVVPRWQNPLRRRRLHALQRPKRFFGAARISKRRQPHDHRHGFGGHRQPHGRVIFEEFKGTGNAEISSTQAGRQALFPAVDIKRSGTARKSCCCLRKCSIASGSCASCSRRSIRWTAWNFCLKK